VVVATVQSGTDLVAPPLEGEGPDGDHVTVTHTRSREHPVHPECTQSAHDLGERLVVREVLETYCSDSRTALDTPGVLAFSFDEDLIGQRLVDDDGVVEFGFLFAAYLYDQLR
jgi:hypothetical protein